MKLSNCILKGLALMLGIGCIQLTGFTANPAFTQLDLRPYYNRPAESWPLGTSWGGLPHGQLEFTGVPFDVEGLFQLLGMTSLKDDDYHIPQVTVPVNAKAEWVHILHGMEHTQRDGVPLWELVIHYADETRESFAIGYGTHVYDWWERPFDRTRTAADPNFEKVWNGSTPETAKHDSSLRLFRGSMKNPHPEKQITSIEMHSLYSSCSPFVMALTLGPAHEGAQSEAAFLPPDLNQIPRMANAEVTVLDTAGRPVKDAPVFARVNWAQGDSRYGTHRTDQLGRITIEYLPEQMNALNLTVAADGYEATQNTLAIASRDSAELQITLQPGSAIAGTVVDDVGQPLSDAVVSIQGIGLDDVGQVIAFKLGEAVTGADGKWRFASAPGEFSDLMFNVKHPKFFDGEFMQSDGSLPGVVTTEELSNGNARFALKPGHSIAGRVVDPDGNGVENARVIVTWSEAIHGVRETATDADGQFEHTLFVSELVDVTVIPEKDWAPFTTKIDLNAETPRQEFKVESGKRIAGVVLDEDGNPASDVVVELGSWGGNKLIAWKTKTDPEGKFEWTGAPTTGSLQFNFMKPGFRPITNRPINAGATDVQIQFNTAFLLVGKVVDAETGEPIPRFRIIGGQSHGPEHVYWERHNMRDGQNGTFLYTQDQEMHGGQIKVMVESDEHWPEVSEALVPNGRHTNVFKLRPGRGASGVVVAADGTPVQGAQVSQLEGHTQFDGKSFGMSGNGALVVTTGGDGSFRFPPRLNKRIVAVHETGYGEVTFDPDEASQLKITLRRPGVIEGVAYAGRDILANAEIMVSDRKFVGNEPFLNYDWGQYKTETGPDGSFRFEEVPHGTRRLVRLIKQDSGSWMHGLQEDVEVKPGETVKVQFGGKGAILIGQIVPDDPDREIAWGSGHHYMHTAYPQPKTPFKTQEEAYAWQQTDEFKEAQKRYRSYPIEFLEDGRFRVTDVEPGEYTLTFHFTEPVAGQRLGGPTIGSLSHKVSITEAHTEPESDPVDVGILDLTLRKVVNIGAPAPEFAVAGFNGETIKLSELRGKYVFLDFWATWCGPCIAELPHLKEAYAELKDDENFVVLSLSLDQEVDAPRKFAEENGMDWMHGFLGEWSQAKLPNQYGVSGIPATFLIDPNGNIVAKNIRGADTLGQIRKHMK